MKISIIRFSKFAVFTALLLLAVIFYQHRLELRRVISAHPNQEKIAFIGDSITAGAGIWGWRIGRPFNTVNLGKNGARIEEIKQIAQAQITSVSRFDTVSIMGGTNDARSHDTQGSMNAEIEAGLKAYIDLIEHLRQSGVKKIIITSTPPQQGRKKNEFTKKLNAALIRHIDQSKCCHYIDLWPTLSDGEGIRSEMTTDGVHFSEKAYKVWARELRKYFQPEIQK